MQQHVPFNTNGLSDQQSTDLRLVFPCNFPATPSMRSADERVRTFSNWHFTRATPQMLAEAGFFSLGMVCASDSFILNHFMRVAHKRWQKLVSIQAELLVFHS